MTKVFLFLLLKCILISTSISLATEPQKPVQPIQIEADHMLSKQKDNIVFFSGKVEAKQDELIIHADEMIVHYSDKTTSSEKQANTTVKSKDVGKIIANGNVEITQLDWVATGESAEYFSTKQKVILTGKVKVWQDNNLITGSKVILYLDEGKSVVERSSQNGERVKAFFYPESGKHNE